MSETLTEWKSDSISITYGPTYGLAGVGARDSCASKMTLKARLRRKTLTAGGDLLILCPVSGHPIAHISWSRGALCQSLNLYEDKHNKNSECCSLSLLIEGSQCMVEDVFVIFFVFVFLLDRTLIIRFSLTFL